MSAVVSSQSESWCVDFSRLFPGVLFHQRPDFSLTFVKGKIEDFTGIPAAEWASQPGERFWSIVHDDDAPRLREQLARAAQSDKVFTSTFRVRDSVTRRLTRIQEHRAARRDQGTLTGFDVLWLDVTGQKVAGEIQDSGWNQTTDKLIHVLIHDFNNLMTGIHAISESFRSQLEAGHAFHEGFEFVQRNAMNAKELVLRMANLHPSHTVKREIYNLNELITSELELTRKIIPRHVRLETRLAQEALPVHGNGYQFRRVITQLVLGAAQMTSQAGLLRLETSRTTQPPAVAAIRGTLPPAPCACLSVTSSTGALTAAQASDLFDPLSDSNPEGRPDFKGISEIVEAHQGAITVESTDASGTTFRVWLPEADFTQHQGRGANHGS